MQSRLWLLPIVLMGAPLIWWHHPTSSSAGPVSAAAPSSQARSLRYLGAGSCSAAACHNNHATLGGEGTEYGHWITGDRHARAYEVLFDELAGRIQKNRHEKLKGHQDRRCLQCHVAPDYEQSDAPPYLKTDGVSCESCHGPAQDWLAVHYQDSWKAKTSTEKHRLGMNDTRSLLGRVQVCVACHVGVSGMDVDHDLIAAGHPRLNFEFASFHASMPHHWPDAKDRDPSVDPRRGGPDFEARAWLVGQLVTAQASLDLLANRADERNKVWPEFAEHDCAACHHDLASPSLRQSNAYYGKRKPGVIPWGNYVAMLQNVPMLSNPRLRTDLLKIQMTFDSGKPVREAVAERAKAAAQQLKSEAFAQQPLDGKSVETLMEALLAADARRAGDWPTQLRLGLAALYLAHKDMNLPLPTMLRDRFLTVVAKTECPNSYDPKAMCGRLNEFKTFGPKER